MYCEKCGTMTENNSAFCPNCGCKLKFPSTTVNNDLSQKSEKSKSEWWCNFLIRIIKFVLVIEIIVAEIAGIILIAMAFDDYGELSVMGLVLIILEPIVAILSNALIMIFAYMAKDI